MLTRLSIFFKTLAEDNSSQSHDDVSLEIACAVLLCEVMRADGELTQAEQEKIAEILVQQFTISADEVNSIIETATQLSIHATDFYQFTSKINRNYTLNERIKIVELLWKIAYADGELAVIEEHIIRKIADLLHLRHSEYIKTKHNNMLS